MDYWIGNVKYTIEDANTKTILDLLRCILNKGVKIYSDYLESKIDALEDLVADLQRGQEFQGVGKYFSSGSQNFWANMPLQTPQYFEGDGEAGSKQSYAYTITKYGSENNGGYYYVLAINPDATSADLLASDIVVNITLPDPLGTLPLYYIQLPNSVMETNEYVNTISVPSPFVCDVSTNITQDKIGNIGLTSGFLYPTSEYKLFLPIIYRASASGNGKFGFIGNKVDLDTNTLQYNFGGFPIIFTI